MVKNLLKYYKESLVLDNLLKMEIADKDLYYGDKVIPKKFDYLAYGISNFFSENMFIDFVVQSIEKFNKEKEENKKKPTGNDPEYPYEFYYAPFFIKKTIQNKKKEKESFNYPIFLITVSHEDIVHLIKNIDTQSSLDKPMKYFNGKFSFHPFSIITGVGCMEDEQMTKFMEELNKQSMNESSPDFEHLIYKMLTLVNTVTNSSLVYNPEDTRTVYDRSIELIKTFHNYYNSPKGDKYQKIEIYKEPWIIAKTKDDADYTKGLLNVYDSIEANDIKDSNPLISILSGNKYQITTVPFEKEIDDKSTAILNKELLIKYLGEQKGAFAKDFDLTYSQKYALAMSKRNFDVTPVNGPPGTGKTSLLRSLIGDITVENALMVYKAYKKGEKSLPFATPIVSFSTNNKALENIVEGINDAFFSTYSIALKNDPKKAVLYKRWINLNFAYYDFDKKERVETTIDDANLYVPFIKNGKAYDFSNPKAPLFFFNIKNNYGIKRFSAELGKNYFEYLKNWLINYIEFIDDERLSIGVIDSMPQDKLLDMAIKDLEKKIQGNIKNGNQKTKQLQTSVSLKKECSPIIRKLYDCLNISSFSGSIISKKDFDIHIFNIDNQINYLKYNIDLVNTNINKRKKEHRNRTHALKENLIKQISFYNSKADNLVKTVSDSVQTEHSDISKKHVVNISILNEDIKKNKESISKSLWGKIKIFLAEKLNIEKLMDYRIVEMEKSIEDFTKMYDESIRNIKVELTTKIETIESNRKSDIQAVKNKNTVDTEVLLRELNARLKEEIDEFIKISDGLSIDESSKKINMASALLKEAQEEDYFFIDDFEKEYMRALKDTDKTTHTDNFFLAWHLLEGLLLKELSRKINISNRGENECFACGKNNLIRENKEKDSYLCTSCKARFINNEIKNIARPLNDFEIKNVLSRGYVEIEKQTYILKANKEPPFWNVAKDSLCKVTDDIEKNFRYSSVFFPIVNTTCHSFGSVFNINEDNTVPERFIDTLFMDESGMILVPFLVNLYAGKKVILFGDEKQIEPVYPFKEHSDACNNILINIYSDNAEEKDIMTNCMSVIKRTSMSLANDASHFKNPYTRNTLPGDLWLKEHFRCRKSIIDFCNKHIYDGYMIPLKVDSEEESIKHLYIRSHNHTQTKLSTGGRINTEEAALIIRYIEDGVNKKFHDNENLSHEDICKKIGIITPYSDQEKELNKQIKMKPNLSGVVAGTVHKFQGSERETIFFSSTIGPNTKNVAKLFFNTDNFNIINVAVSRAKDTFILFGNTEKINEAPMSHIGLLLGHITEHQNKSVGEIV